MQLFTLLLLTFVIKSPISIPFSFAGLSFSSPLDLILEYPTTKTPLLESLTPTLSPPGVTYISLFLWDLSLHLLQNQKKQKV